jgi:hypothetical protein
LGRGIEAATVPEGGWGLKIRRQRNLNSKLTKNASYQKGCPAAVLVQAIPNITFQVSMDGTTYTITIATTDDVRSIGVETDSPAGMVTVPMSRPNSAFKRRRQIQNFAAFDDRGGFQCGDGARQR